MSAVAFDRLSVSLGGTEVLHGVSAAVESGEWVAVIGPNGAGKTTLLRTIASLVPFAGSIELLGDDLRSLPHRERARRVALVAQIPTMPAEMTSGCASGSSLISASRPSTPNIFSMSMIACLISR